MDDNMRAIFSYKDPAPHFAGTFAAKEATRKATAKYPRFSDVEVRRTKQGKPEIWVCGKRSRSLLVSITHTKTIACAIVFLK